MSRTVRWEQTPAHQLPLEERLCGFAEVNLGYTLEEAMAEAERCLQCARPACEEGCPNNNPIREFLYRVAEGDLLGAAELDWSRNALPACTGRVCAWEKQCEGFCVMSHRGDPIKIGAIERFFADYALARLEEDPDCIAWRDPDYEPREQRVAIVGAGPAGLAAAHFLARKGYPVTVFERWPVPGGVMAYGIPEFVLPQKVIDAEVRRLQQMGVEIRTGVTVGEDVTVDELFAQGYEAIFIGVGANEPARLGIEGEDLPGVWTAKDFLMRTQAAVNLRGRLKGALPDAWLEPPVVGRRVAVIGAGNTAMDAARTARRLGAEEVMVLYRRDAASSPSRPIEVEHAQHEGVTFMYLVNPKRFIAGDDGRVAAVELVRMRLAAPDDSGRARPVPIPGSEFVLPVDTVITAIGYQQESLIAETARLATTPWGGLIIDEETGATSRPGVFAGGDCVTGPNTVIHAIAAGRRAAAGIDRYLREKARAAARARANEDRRSGQDPPNDDTRGHDEALPNDETRGRGEARHAELAR
ncbi:MAG TPA: NAD(P)-dependent oxidoreductase [Limnochordales bacterium]